MKKILLVLMAFAIMLTAIAPAFAEEQKVNAEITIVTDEKKQGVTAPEIPAGTLSADVFGFDSNQAYAVYSAPDVQSIRGAGGKSKVSTNDWIQVFGQEGDWVMVQYDVNDSYYRIGYISAKSIPVGMTVPALSLTDTAAVVTADVNVTDDPLGKQKTLVKLSLGSHVTRLGTMGEWAYVEGTSNDKLFRGFVPNSVLSEENVVLSLKEAVRVLAGTWTVYAGDAGNADYLRFQADGYVYGQLAGDADEWSGHWELDRYDTTRNTYWNDPEFELTITMTADAKKYGLRICWEPYGANGADYALILSESNLPNGLVLCR